MGTHGQDSIVAAGLATPAARYHYDVAGVLPPRQASVVVMNINDENLRVDKIEVRDGDDAMQLAEGFVADNGLGRELVEPLTPEWPECA